MSAIFAATENKAMMMCGVSAMGMMRVFSRAKNNPL
jgi:hypothetical protein